MGGGHAAYWRLPQNCHTTPTPAHRQAASHAGLAPPPGPRRSSPSMMDWVRPLLVAARALALHTNSATYCRPAHTQRRQPGRAGAPPWAAPILALEKATG